MKTIHPPSSNLETVLTALGLQFAYRPGQPVLKNVDLSIPPNSIYGFLGANGAGKSTTIRMLLGLLRPTRGRIHVFGLNPLTDRAEVLPKIGSLIEAPSLYLHLNATDHLKMVATYRGVPKRRILEVLDLVGLTASAHRPCRQYSTGMKQRLGLAIAILHKPDLLVLDEPTNGLDPNGIIEIRQLLRQLHAEGTTILLSSHLLSEIERIATRVGILQAGTIAFEGPMEALQRQRNTELTIEITTSQAGKALELLGTQFHCQRLEAERIRVQVSDREAVATLNQALVAAHIPVYELLQQKRDLETLFVQLTQLTTQ